MDGSNSPRLWDDMTNYIPELFTKDEAVILSRYFTNLDKPVFALVNLPEVVKGALFARYSRSAKSLRRLFLDEFYEQVDPIDSSLAVVGTARAERLYEKVLSDYGDDSVAQLGGVHLACEQASNILTKVLERGRLMAYLEQSTRYVPYDQPRPDGRFKYFIPSEIVEAGLESLFRVHMDRLFLGYKQIFSTVEAELYKTTVKESSDSDFVYRSSVRAVALDSARGILPASVLSNVGIFASAQAYEALILRMRASDLSEIRIYAELIKTELDKVIPAFLARLDRPERGGAWVEYLASRSSSLTDTLFDPRRVRNEVPGEPDEVSVELVRYDPEGEVRVAAGIIYAYSDVSMSQALELARGLESPALSRLIEDYVGDRTNRRHRPGRAFEETSYLFDIECDYGAFRDLQRHRMLNIEWQTLGTSLGYVVPELVADFGLVEKYGEILGEARSFHQELLESVGPRVAAYAVPMAYRIRFSFDLNAREAMHLIELRSSPQGHTTYRKVAQKMYGCIANVAHHRNIASAMKFVDLESYRLGRLSSLRHEEKKGKSVS